MNRQRQLHRSSDYTIGEPIGVFIPVSNGVKGPRGHSQMKSRESCFSGKGLIGHAITSYAMHIWGCKLIASEKNVLYFWRTPRLTLFLPDRLDGADCPQIHRCATSNG